MSAEAKIGEREGIEGFAVQANQKRPRGRAREPSFAPRRRVSGDGDGIECFEDWGWFVWRMRSSLSRIR